MPHNTKADYRCEDCGMEVRSFIIHECDPSICRNCHGTGTIYAGREHRLWVGYRECEKCEGTGETIWESESPQ